MNGLCKILIIDDEYILRNGIKYICDWEKEGFVIVGEADNGEDALESIEELRPNIVITDIVMPGLDGIDLTKSIKEIDNSIKVLVLSSFSDFEYVKESFKCGVSDYILKPKVTKDTLLAILKKIKKEINVDFNGEKANKFNKLIEILSLYLKGEEFLHKDKNILNEYFCEKDFRILKIPINSFSDGNLNNKNLLNSKLQNFIESKLGQFKTLHVIEFQSFTIIINYDRNRDIELNKAIKELLNLINEEYFNVLILMGNIFSNMDNMYKKNIYLNSIINKSFYFEPKIIIKEEELFFQDKEIKFKLEEFNSKLLGFEFETCKIILSEYFRELKEVKELDEYSFKRFCQNIIYNIINKVEEVGLDLSELNTNKIRIFKSIDLCFTFNDIVNVVYNFLDKINNIKKRQVNNKYIIINKIKHYVDENYSSEINLTDIANTLHMDYYYLSHYFKEQTNENLSVYINKVRVEKSKKYLADNKTPISEVSDLVGFSEHNYFSKIFKKYTGITPSEYKKRMLVDVQKK